MFLAFTVIPETHARATDEGCGLLHSNNKCSCASSLPFCNEAVGRCTSDLPATIHSTFSCPLPLHDPDSMEAIMENIFQRTLGVMPAMRLYHAAVIGAIACFGIASILIVIFRRLRCDAIPTIVAVLERSAHSLCPHFLLASERASQSLPLMTRRSWEWHGSEAMRSCEYLPGSRYLLVYAPHATWRHVLRFLRLRLCAFTSSGIGTLGGSRTLWSISGPRCDGISK
jgi:hypothetical protein